MTASEHEERSEVGDRKLGGVDKAAVVRMERPCAVLEMSIRTTRHL